MTTPSPSNKPIKYVELITDSFGFIVNKTGENIQVKRFTWKNSNRIQVQVITYGATVVSIRYPNKKGIVEDVVPGFENLQSYIEYQNLNFGSTIGRHANYVKNACFNMAKNHYMLSANLGKHHYNGGKKGFNQVVWNHTVSGNKVTLSHLSLDGDEGYPGDLLVFATFELNSQNEFRIEYKAMSTKQTIINIANHIYVNLAGHSTGETEINNHILMLNADCYTEIGEDLVPTGEIQSVLHTIYDFQTPTKLGPLLDKLEGYDNNFCVNRGTDQGVNFVGRLYHPSSGRIMEVYSNQYGVHIDTANSLPSRCEPEELNVIRKVAKCPYLRSGVTTFDMLDEIYNKIADIRIQDPMNDYEDILTLVQEIQKKSGTVYRNTTNADGNSGIKRSSLTMESLPVFQLTPLQLKYIERIIKSFESVKDSALLEAVKTVLDSTIYNNKLYQETLASGVDKKKSEESSKIIRGKKGAKYCRHGAISLQCQNYPDSINNTRFPSPVLKPGNTYNNIIVYKFWVKTDQSGVVGFLQV